jgi:E3 ubiquitin-protein ligase TRIP12
MITAVLAYIDFFSSSIQVIIGNSIFGSEKSVNLLSLFCVVQRVAVSAVANACKKVPADCSMFVMDSVPMLCNLLQSEDKMVLFSYPSN